MTYLTDLCNSIFNYLYALIGIDFTGYSGNLPSQFIEMYSYVEQFFKLVIIFYFIYFVYNTLIFLFSLGGIRK